MKCVKYLFLGLILVAMPDAQSMEKKEQVSLLQGMPPEIKAIIITKVAGVGSFNEAIDNLRALSSTNKDFNMWIKDPLVTREIVELLVRKFNMPQMTFEYATEGKIGWNEEAVQEYFEQGNALLKAIKDQNVAQVKKLLQEGADSNYVAIGQLDSRGSDTSDTIDPVLFYAIYQGNFEIIKLLVNYGADINYQEIDPESHHAVDALVLALTKTQNPEIIEFLLQSGAQVNEDHILFAETLDKKVVDMIQQAYDQQQNKK